MEPACAGCRERDARIALLEGRVAELEAQVPRPARAPSATTPPTPPVPPSANPLHAPKPVVKKRTGRKPGGQPGHPPHPQATTASRTRQRYVSLRALPLRPVPGPFVGPSPRQMTHRPPGIKSRNCPRSSPRSRSIRDTHGLVPAAERLLERPSPPNIRAHCCGPRPRLATLAYLTGGHQLSKIYAVEEISEDVFAAPVALGTVSALEQEVSAAAGTHPRRGVASSQRSPRQKRRRGPVGSKADANAGCGSPRRRTRRHLRHLRPAEISRLWARLLGNTIYGFLCSLYRWSVYDHWPTAQRQVCWSHPAANFQKCVDRGGRGGRHRSSPVYADRQVRVFQAWHLYRGGGLSHQAMRKRLDPVLRATCGSCLTQGVTAPDSSRPQHLRPTW